MLYYLDVAKRDTMNGNYGYARNSPETDTLSLRHENTMKTCSSYAPHRTNRSNFERTNKHQK